MAWAMISAIIFAPFFIASSKMSLVAGPAWAKVSLWLVRIICGITYEVRGRENITTAPAIYASKHQSAWDTVRFLALFNNPAYVLKRELLRIPLWGWYLWRMRMIAIDRGAGASTMKQLIKQAKEVVADGRPIVIFPEGTRMPPGAPTQYHPGVLALYSQLKIPLVPIALNSGVFWGRNAFTKRPGKIIIEFLPAIAPGLPKDTLNLQMQAAIESATARLLNETGFTPIQGE